MASIDDLLEEISDTRLKQRLQSEYERLLHRKKFGLVFENHIPDLTPLFNVPIHKGSKVSPRDSKMDKVYSVMKIEREIAYCFNHNTNEISTFDLSELVVVAQFGDPIFPTLKSMDIVENAPDSQIWHSLIEADNYHALQLLEYLYPGKVDCIYIDPPYNTGAKDWKYNNNYVDSSDSWRHSKWLSMMKKRLVLAKKLLADDGVLITTIDDNEYAHLWMLLNEIFPSLVHTPITIQHNPGGTQGKSFSVTHEYAIYSYSNSSKIYRKEHMGGDVYNLRRWGSTSSRYEGKTCFYPVILNSDFELVGFGDLLEDNLHPTAQFEYQPDGTIYVWPLDRNGEEKKWRYARATVEGVQSRMFIEKKENRIEIMLRREDEPPKTVWTDSLFNAEAHGTGMIKNIIDNSFSYPKSLYAVHNALKFAVAGKKDALVLDFFAGSGTTLHALNLLNFEDGGTRRGILVTNNEVSEQEVKNLRKKGVSPGEYEWEKHGICQAITWPRTKNSILGKKEDGTPLKGEYFTTKSKIVELSRNFYQLGFIENIASLSLSAKKQLVSLLRSKNGTTLFPQTAVKKNTRYIVSPKQNAAILFDLSSVEEWLEEIEQHSDLSEFYIVTSSTSIFNDLKNRVISITEPLTTTSPVKLPFSEGFASNVEYFKLEFLDKNRVSRGQQFKEILPLLWMKSGSVGKRPVYSKDEETTMLIPENSNFAVLMDESDFMNFSMQLKSRDNVKDIYLVTNSDDAFRDMSYELNGYKTYQLYRDYIDNFVIGSRRIL